MPDRKRHANIPVFVTHMGCPFRCVFCDQGQISGCRKFNEQEAVRTIEEHLSTIEGTDTVPEIAFFGGSFTGIERGLMTRLLDLAQSYVDSGRVSGIRMSTRPDYIDEDIIRILQGYTVSQVELGIQSMSDEVLKKCKRGHTADMTVRACRLLRENGFSIVGQMMTGLPGATAADEVECAKAICEMGADGSRIYPTVVLKGTELERMYRDGEYVPMSNDEAAERSADVLGVFVSGGVSCLRIGLADISGIRHSDGYIAGPDHPAIGELVKGRLYRKRICRLLEELPEDGSREICISVPQGDISKAVGHGRCNMEIYASLSKNRKIRFREDPSLAEFTVQI